MLAIWLALLSAAPEGFEAELRARSERLRIAFDPGSDELQAAGISALEPLVPLLSSVEVVVEVSGHTDANGDRQANLALSQRRAEAVRRWLVSRGVPPERLVARGVGDQQPRASNATPEGRARNRRIELFIEGHRPAAPPAPDGPARLTFVKPAVERRPAAAAEFSLAALGDSLYPRDQVGTREEAAAEITFADTSYLRLRGNALIIIGATRSRPGEAARDLELVRGTGELSFSGEGKVTTPAAQVAARARELVLDVDEKKMSRVSVHAGEAQVSARGASEKVPEGYGTRAALGRPPEKARPLPGRVTFTMPLRRARLDGSTAAAPVFSWAPATRAARYRFDLAADPRFNQRVLSAQTSQTRFVAPALEPGRYFARVVSIDADGLLGRPSLPAELAVLAAPRRVPRGQPLELELPEGTQAVLDGQPLAPAPGAADAGTPARPDAGTAVRAPLTPGQHRLGVRAVADEPFDEVSFVAQGAAPEVVYDDELRLVRLEFPSGERPAPDQVSLEDVRGRRALPLTPVGDDAYEAHLPDDLLGRVRVGSETVAEVSHRIGAPAPAQAPGAQAAPQAPRPASAPAAFPRPDVPSHRPGQLEAAGEVAHVRPDVAVAAFTRTTLERVETAGARLRAEGRWGDRLHVSGLFTFEQGAGPSAPSAADVALRLTAALGASNDLGPDAPVRLAAVVDAGARVWSSNERPSAMGAFGLLGSVSSGRLRLSTSHQVVLGFSSGGVEGAYRLNALLGAFATQTTEVHLGVDGLKPLRDGSAFEWALSLGLSGRWSGGWGWSLALYGGLGEPGAARYGALSAIGSLSWAF